MTDIRIKQLTAMTAINVMMRTQFFSICTIREVADLLGIVPDRDAFNTLQALHCVHFDDMPRELYLAIPGLIQKCLSGREVFQFQLASEHKQLDIVVPINDTKAEKVAAAYSKPGFLGRLINRHA